MEPQWRDPSGRAGNHRRSHRWHAKLRRCTRHAAERSHHAHYVESPDFRLTSDGTVYTREGLSEVLAGSATKLSKMAVAWDSIRVTPLGPEAAFVVAPFRRADFSKNGSVERIRGVATWVWVRRDGQWKMLYGHGDHYPDQSLAQPGG